MPEKARDATFYEAEEERGREFSPRISFTRVAAAAAIRIGLAIAVAPFPAGSASRNEWSSRWRR
ncbi:MAG: hypothetical protein ACLQU1_38340 [Bryobacteraceae bacterium]